MLYNTCADRDGGLPSTHGEVDTRSIEPVKNRDNDENDDRPFVVIVSPVHLHLLHERHLVGNRHDVRFLVQGVVADIDRSNGPGTPVENLVEKFSEKEQRLA